VAAKAGFFKLIWIAILGAKKALVVGVVAIGAVVKRILGARKKAIAEPTAPEPPAASV